MRRVRVTPVRAARTHHKERVLHRARGMTRRDAKRREVVVIRLDLGPLRDAVAQADEEIYHLVYDPQRRMEVTFLKRDTGQRDVNRLLAQTFFPLAGRHLPHPGVEGGFDLPRSHVGRPAHLLALVGREASYALLDLRKLRGSPEIPHPHVFEDGRGIARGDGGEGLRSQLLDSLAYRHNGRL